MSENPSIFQSFLLDDLSNEMLYRLNHNPMLAIRREKIEHFYSKFKLLTDYRLLRCQAAKLYSCIMQYCECILMFVQDNLISLKKNEVDYLKRWLNVLYNLAVADSIKNKLTLFMPLVQKLISEDFPLWITKEFMLQLNLIFEKPTEIIFGSKEKKFFLCTVEKLLKLIMTCGDYELQTILVETIISTCEWCHIEEVLARNFGDTNGLTIMLFQVYSKQNYVNNLKSFLTAINDKFDYVRSVPCLNVTFEKTVLPIKGTNGDGTWMHVNFGFRTFSFGCSNKFVTVDFDNIDKICLLMNDSKTLGKFLINLSGKETCRFDGDEFISSTKLIKLTMADGSHLQFLRKAFIILFGGRFKEANKFPIEKRNLEKKENDLSVKGDRKKKNTIHNLENYCLLSPDTTTEFMNNKKTNITNKSSSARKENGGYGTRKNSLDIDTATTSKNKEMSGSCNISLADVMTIPSTYKFGEDNSLIISENNNSIVQDAVLLEDSKESNQMDNYFETSVLNFGNVGVIYKKEDTRNDDLLMLDNQESEYYLFKPDFTSTVNDQLSSILDFLDNHESISTPNMGNENGQISKVTSLTELSQKNTTIRYEECGNLELTVRRINSAENANFSNASGYCYQEFNQLNDTFETLDLDTLLARITKSIASPHENSENENTVESTKGDYKNTNEKNLDKEVMDNNEYQTVLDELNDNNKNTNQKMSINKVYLATEPVKFNIGNISDNITQITTLIKTEEQTRNADIGIISMSSMEDIDFDASTVVNVQFNEKCVTLWNDLQERKNEETRLNSELPLIMQKYNELERKDMETLELTHNSEPNKACRKKSGTPKRKRTKEQITSQLEKCNGNVEKYFQNFSKKNKNELFDISDEKTNYFEKLKKPLEGLPTKRLLLNNFNTSQSKSTLSTLKTNKSMETNFEMLIAKNKLNSQELTLSPKMTLFDMIAARGNKNVAPLNCELQKSPLNKSVVKVKVQNNKMTNGEELSKQRLSDKKATTTTKKRIKLAEDVRLSRKVHKSKEDNFAKFTLETSLSQFNESRKSTPSDELTQKMRKSEVCNLKMMETESRESDRSRKLMSIRKADTKKLTDIQSTPKPHKSIKENKDLSFIEVFESIPPLEPVKVKKVIKEVQSTGKNQKSNESGFDKLEAINEEFGLLTKQQSTKEMNTTSEGIRSQVPPDQSYYNETKRFDNFDDIVSGEKAYLATVKKPIEKKKPRKRRSIKMKYTRLKKTKRKSEK